MLKERRAAQDREFDREEARYLYRSALEMVEEGDTPGAARAAKKALHLDPDLYPALDLLARIHYAAEQYDQAISYLQLLRKYPQAVSVGYNLGQSNLALGRTEEALENFREFLEATRALPGRQWKHLREEARRLCADLEKSAAPIIVTQPAPRTPPPTSSIICITGKPSRSS